MAAGFGGREEEQAGATFELDGQAGLRQVGEELAARVMGESVEVTGKSRWRTGEFAFSQPLGDGWEAEVLPTGREPSHALGTEQALYISGFASVHGNGFLGVFPEGKARRWRRLPSGRS